MTRSTIGVFLVLMGSYAYYWQARDWNTASRLMLTYAIVDRGTIAIDGLERQTGDKAFYRGHFYSDKGPGFSMLAAPAYGLSRSVLGMPAHPVDEPGYAYWRADYGVTLLTSGLATAMLGALICGLATRFGCGPRTAILTGVAYGLATPAFAYATLAYGHQVAACLLFVGLWLTLDDRDQPGPLFGFGAGLATGLGVLVELSTAPVAVLFAMVFLARGFGRGHTFSRILAYCAGAMIPASVLFLYNTWAFDSPFDLGYAHHTIPQFLAVHDADHPLGLRWPDWGRAWPLLWGEYRGLLIYAPIAILAPIGWARLAIGGRAWWSLASLGACLCGFLVNLSYPEWTGGWSTGPRLLTTYLPFLMVGVVGSLFGSSRVAVAVAAILTSLGAVAIGLSVGAGGRFPDRVGPEGGPLLHPIREAAIPLWRGDLPPRWWVGERFTRTLFDLADPEAETAARGADAQTWAQFLPLWAFQAAALGLLFGVAGRGAGGGGGGSIGSDELERIRATSR